MDRSHLLQHFDDLANAPDVVAKLRSLVLDLAIRGNLVSQDLADLPAQRLFDLASAERGEKRSKRQATGEDGAGGAPFDLPKNWCWTSLEAIGDTAPRNDLPDDSEVGFSPMRLIPIKFGEPVSFETRTWAEVRKGFTHFAEGDVVLAKITPCFQNGKSAVIRNAPGGHGAGTTELHVFRPVSGCVLPEFVLIFLKSPHFLLSGEAHMTGTAGQKRIPWDYFARTLFPLPPLAEQKRIVAKVEELLELCDELEARQTAAREHRIRLVRSAFDHLTSAATPTDFRRHAAFVLKEFPHLTAIVDAIPTLRQAILSLAVQGHLVPQDPTDEPAESILRATRTLFEHLAAEKKISTPKPLAPINADEVPFILPGGWAWCRLGQIIRIASGDGLTAEDMKEGTVPVYGGNGVNGHHDKYNVGKRTLVIGRVGFYCGSIHLTPDKAWVTDNAFITTFSEDHLAIAFLVWLLKATDLRERDNATAQPVISGSKIYPTILAIPPLAEQKRIVAKVEELMRWCDQLEAQLTGARRSAENLLDATVAQLTSARNGETR